MKTQQEIEAMSDEERMIETAELCGWNRVKEQNHCTHLGMPAGRRLYGMQDESTIRELIPQYLHDLNAMHEAEQVMGFKQRQSFAITLCEMIPCLLDTGFSAIHATARQRNTAFLMVML